MTRPSLAAAALLPLVLAIAGGAALAQDASPATEPGASPAPIASPGTGMTGSPAPGTTVEGEVLVTAVEYEFVGIPATAATGTTFRLQNGGQELHEFVVVRRNEGTDQPVEELLAMGDAAFEAVTIVGALMAEPGQTAEGTVVATEPGRYIAICNIPVGTTSLADLGGPAATTAPAAGASPAASPGGIVTHAELGMIAEFTVGSDGATMDAGASPDLGSAAASPAAGALASPAPTAGS